MKAFLLAAVSLLLFGVSTLTLAADESLLKNSPFVAPGSAGSSSAPDSPLDQLEFSGVSVIGKDIFVSVIDKKSGRGSWLPLKSQGSDGLVVENYDAKKDEVTVRLGQQTRILSLRMTKITIGAPRSPSGPAAASSAVPPAAASPPLAAASTPASGKSSEVEVQEREARLLVSDLLEIGMIQRKAYAEKKAAEEAARKKQP